ncbi:hypothetical protein AB0284_13600 [Pseudarthrobacter phenanthrenivorans]|uniref:hypothetical protein n=1 Tax=Pseudarthrobacter phenanthrenivorans TaxID=361575 RepID=UPI00344FB928
MLLSATAHPTAGTRRGVRGVVILCCALLAGLLVAGAAGFRPGVSEESVLRGFQVRVLSISQAAAENRMDGALAALQALEKDLNEAAAAGRLSAARYRGIETALAAVRADIATQVAAAAPAAPTATAPNAAGAAPPLAETAGTNPAPAAPEVPAAAPEPAPAPQGPGSQAQDGSQGQDVAKEAKGKGKGQGKP